MKSLIDKQPMPRPIRRAVAGVTVAVVILVAGLIASSYEQAVLYKHKESESLMAARWLNIAFVGANPNVLARRRSGADFQVFQSSRILEADAGVAPTIESAAPTTTITTNSPSVPPTAFPSSTHPSVGPSTDPSPQPTLKVSYLSVLVYLILMDISHRDFPILYTTAN